MRAYRISKYAISIVFLMGAAILCHFIWRNHNVQRAKHWPLTDAVVSSCQVVSSTNLIEGGSGNRVVRNDQVTFAFTYTVAGRQYISTRFYPPDQQPAYWVAIQYPVGRHFAARYNPDAPEEAVVEPGNLNYLALAGAIIFSKDDFAAEYLNLLRKQIGGYIR